MTSFAIDVIILTCHILCMSTTNTAANKTSFDFEPDIDCACDNDGDLCASCERQDAALDRGEEIIDTDNPDRAAYLVGSRVRGNVWGVDAMVKNLKGRFYVTLRAQEALAKELGEWEALSAKMEKAEQDRIAKHTEARWK